MARQPRIDLPGIPQHIVQRGHGHQPCFFARADCLRYLQHLGEIARREYCHVHAYVLMDNHVHLLATPMVAGGVGRMMQALGTRYVRYVNHRYQRTGTLWDGRYRACPVLDDAYLLRCQRHVERNPLRARMVQDLAHYPWSSFRGNTAPPGDPLLTPHRAWLALGPDTPARHRAWHAFATGTVAPDETEAIRQHLRCQHLHGPEARRRDIEARLGRALGPGRRGRPRKAGAMSGQA